MPDHYEIMELSDRESLFRGGRNRARRRRSGQCGIECREHRRAKERRHRRPQRRHRSRTSPTTKCECRRDPSGARWRRRDLLSSGLKPDLTYLNCASGVSGARFPTVILHELAPTLPPGGTRLSAGTSRLGNCLGTSTQDAVGLELAGGRIGVGDQPVRAVASYARKETAIGYLTPSTGTDKIFTPRASTIRKVHVHERRQSSRRRHAAEPRYGPARR